jgi:hypothetical protein
MPKQSKYDDKAQNSNLKKMQDDIISQGGEKLCNTINKIIGSTLADVTFDLR